MSDNLRFHLPTISISIRRVLASFGRTTVLPLKRLLCLRLHLPPEPAIRSCVLQVYLRIRNTITLVSTNTCEREVAGGFFGRQMNRIQPLHRIAIEGDFRTSNAPYASYCPSP